jgi:AraC-like DNA-binding protein
MYQSNDLPAASESNWKISPILKAADYVESHIHQVIRIADMADAAGYSVFHFCRCFNEVAKHSPYDYQMKRKLSCALDALISEKYSITRVAMEFGFETPEGFSRAFKKMYGTLPSAIRKGQRPDSRLSLPKLTEKYLRNIEHLTGKTPACSHFADMELSGVTDRHLCLAESLNRSMFNDGVAVVDYLPGWQAFGPQIFLGTDHNRSIDVESPVSVFLGKGMYITFSLDCPIDDVDSFLEYVFTVFYRRSKAVVWLPKRIIFTVKDGNLKSCRMFADDSSIDK